MKIEKIKLCGYITNKDIISRNAYNVNKLTNAILCYFRIADEQRLITPREGYKIAHFQGKNGK